MTKEYLKILQRFKNKSVGIFVDEANLFYSQKAFIFVCFEHNVAWEIRKSYHVFFEHIEEEIKFLK